MYRPSLLLFTIALLPACQGAKDGTVSVLAWGEEAPYEGFPNSELSFIDGWSLSFTHSITSFSAIELGDPSDDTVEASSDKVYVADWVDAQDPVDVVDLDVAEGRHTFGFSFVPAEDGATEVDDVDDTVLATMVTEGWNTYIEGTATKDTRTVTFKWGMANAAAYRLCTNGLDETDGVAVNAGETTEATIFVHQDHTYWDRLGTEEANLRFEAPAAWADSGGEVHLDDLADVDIAAIEDPDGNPVLDENGDPLAYDDAGLGLSDLKSFILYSTAQQGHLNGEGECTVTDL